MLTTFIREPKRSARTGYCPACGRWVLLDEVWGCRFCRAGGR